LADNVAAAKDRDLSPLQSYLGPNQQLTNPGRRAGLEPGWIAEHQFANVHRMKPVDIFRRRHRSINDGLADLSGQRGLDQNSMQTGVPVQSLEQSQHLGFGSLFGQDMGFGEYPQLGAGLFLPADINSGGWIFTDSDESQARRNAAGFESRDARRQFA